MDRTLLKENRMHGEISFPISAYHVEVPAASGETVLECHWHDELEFLSVVSGKAAFQVENTHYNVRAGEALFINSGELHAGYCLDGSPCAFDAVVFSPALLHSGSLDIICSRYIDPLIKGRISVKKHLAGENGWECELLGRLGKIPGLLFGKSAAYELQVKSELFGALAVLCANSVPSAPADDGSRVQFQLEKLKTALKFIQDNYALKISTVDISNFINMSEGHFCRLFRQYFRKTPMEYLNGYRVNRAARLLEETGLKVLEIAMEVGFDNISYFIDTFKRHFGTTPLNYRRLKR